MTPPTPPPPEPTDEQGTFAAVARLLLTQLLAVVGVAAVIAVVFTLAGRGTGTDVPAAQGSPASASVAAPTATPTSTPPTGSAAAAPPPTTSAAPPPTTSAAPPPTTAPAPSRPKVDVLNQSAGGGTASATADQLRSAGWRIGRVADFHGNVAKTTVYYPAGMRRDARELAKDLPGSPRLRERFSTLSPTHLSIVLVG